MSDGGPHKRNFLVLPSELPKISPDDIPGPVSDYNLIRAVRLWMAGEPETNIIGLLQCSTSEFQDWTNCRGWQYVVACLKDQVQDYASQTLGRLSSRIIDNLRERVDRGDPVHIAVRHTDPTTGEVSVEERVVYKPIKGKDLAAIYAVVIDRKHEIEKRLNGKSDSDEIRKSVDDLVAKLQNFGKDHAAKHFRNVKTVNGDASRID